MLSQKFWRETLERAIKTAAQVAGAMIVGDGFGFFSVNWPEVGNVTLLAVIASLLTSISSVPFGSADSPSLVD